MNIKYIKTFAGSLMCLAALSLVGCNDKLEHQDLDPKANAPEINGPELDYAPATLTSDLNRIVKRPDAPEQVAYNGAKDYSSNFWSVFTPAWRVSNNGLLRVSFFMYMQDGCKDYQTWFNVFNEAPAEGSEEEFGAEIWVGRGDVHCAPKPKEGDDGSVGSSVDHIPATAHSTNASWTSCNKFVLEPAYGWAFDDFNKIMNGAYVTVDIYKMGTEIQETITIQAEDGSKYTASYKTAGKDCGIPANDIVVRFSLEKSYYAIDTQNSWYKNHFADETGEGLNYGDMEVAQFEKPAAADVLEIDETAIPTEPKVVTDMTAIQYMPFLGSEDFSSTPGQAKMAVKINKNDRVDFDFVTYGDGSVNSAYVINIGNAFIYGDSFAQEGSYTTDDEEKSQYCGVRITEKSEGFDEIIKEVLAEANVHVEVYRTGKAFMVKATATSVADDTKVCTFVAQSTTNTTLAPSGDINVILTNNASYQKIKSYTEYGEDASAVDVNVDLKVTKEIAGREIVRFQFDSEAEVEFYMYPQEGTWATSTNGSKAEVAEGLGWWAGTPQSAHTKLANGETLIINTRAEADAAGNIAGVLEGTDGSKYFDWNVGNDAWGALLDGAAINTYVDQTAAGTFKGFTVAGNVMQIIIKRTDNTYEVVCNEIEAEEWAMSADPDYALKSSKIFTEDDGARLVVEFEFDSEAEVEFNLLGQVGVWRVSTNGAAVSTLEGLGWWPASGAPRNELVGVEDGGTFVMKAVATADAAGNIAAVVEGTDGSKYFDWNVGADAWGDLLADAAVNTYLSQKDLGTFMGFNTPGNILETVITRTGSTYNIKCYEIEAED